MIIFYNNQTGAILGVINGRVHTDQVLATSLGISDLDPALIGKYVVPVRLTKTEALYDVPFADTLLEFESSAKNIYDYKVVLDNGTVTGFIGN